MRLSDSERLRKYAHSVPQFKTSLNVAKELVTGWTMFPRQDLSCTKLPLPSRRTTDHGIHRTGPVHLSPPFHALAVLAAPDGRQVALLQRRSDRIQTTPRHRYGSTLLLLCCLLEARAVTRFSTSAKSPNFESSSRAFLGIRCIVLGHLTMPRNLGPQGSCSCCDLRLSSFHPIPR